MKTAAILSTITLVSVISGAAWGQAVGGGITISRPIRLEANRQYRFSNGESRIYDKDYMYFARAGEIVTGPSETLRSPRTYGNFAVYPFTIFSVAGVVPDPNNPGGFMGGTRSVTGSLYSLSYGSLLKGSEESSMEIGGFYFQPSRRNEGSIYQLDARYMARYGWGVQAAFLNDASGNSKQAYSLHGVFRLTPYAVNAGSAKNWELNLGIGGMLNSEKEEGNFGGGNTTRELQTFNWSSFINGSVALNRTVNLSAFMWHFRDRNVDVTRFSIGASYKF